MDYESAQRDITMALAGDCLIHRAVSCYREEAFLELVRLMREADVTYANLEGVTHQYEAPPEPRPGGYWTAFHPRLLEELKWMGIQMVSTANNHSMDYGEWGLTNTLKHVDLVGLGHAGTGRTLFEARAPGYLEVAAGRVALVSATATFETHYRAGEQSPQVTGRPGANCLGSVREYVVDRETFGYLRQLGERIGDEARKERARQYNIFPVPEDTDTQYHFLGHRFVGGDTFTVRSRCNPRDKEAILRQVRDAASMAEWVIVAVHCHEYDLEPETPPLFLQEFARACIDAGAHCFVGHGPHFVQGIEVYEGRPIFYSLGNFIVELETIFRHPPDVYQRYDLGLDSLPGEMIARRLGDEAFHMAAHPRYWRSVLPICDWKGGKLRQVRLYPLDMGFKRPWAARGRPMLASGEVKEEVLEVLIRASEHFGTEVRRVDGVGVITPTA